jgi:hypothetical protein
MEQLGTDFNATGSVMSRAELEDLRRKRGECVTCGRKCFQKKLFKMIPITDHGRVLNGRCLNCNPLDAADGALPAVSRPATQADLARFTRSQNNLRSGASGTASVSGSSIGSHTTEPEQRRKKSGRTSSRRSSDQSSTASASNRTNSLRSLNIGSVSSGSQQSSNAGYDYASTMSDGLPKRDKRTSSNRSFDSVQSSPSRTVDSDAISYGNGSVGPRPVLTRPGSNRSISGNSYYSTRSKTSKGSSSGVSREGEGRRSDGSGGDSGGRNNRTSYANEDESEEYDDYHDQLQSDEAHYEHQDYPRPSLDMQGEPYDSGAEPAASLDFYSRGVYRNEYSSRSLRSNDSHESGNSRDEGDRFYENGSEPLGSGSAHRRHTRRSSNESGGSARSYSGPSPSSRGRLQEHFSRTSIG